MVYTNDINVHLIQVTRTSFCATPHLLHHIFCSSN